MKFDNIQNNFTVGEVSPKLWGRTDLEKYSQSAAIVENLIVQPYGGLIRRGGFHYIAEVKDSTKNIQLIPFVYMNTHSYILEFGSLYIRVYVNNTQVLDGAVPYEIETFYLSSDVKELRFYPDKDTLYITHSNYPPAKLTRTAHDSWTLEDIPFNFDYNYEGIWVSQASAADNDWTSVCWSPELSLAVAVSSTGVGNRVMTSPDGKVWTIRTSAADNDWTSVCWSPGLSLFVAVADTGVGNRVMTSPDGITWTIQTSAADNDWTSVCWSPELSLLVAVSNTGVGNRVMTSPDGVAWTIQSSAVDNDWTSVCWSPELSLFVAVSKTGTGDRVMLSPEGVVWISRTSAADNDWTSVCWSSDLELFIAVSNTGASDRVMTSPNGTTWTIRVSAADNNWTSVCWATELQKFIAVSNSGAGNRVMMSSDGITWESLAVSINNDWTSVCWSFKNSLLIAVANTGTGSRVMTSFAASLLWSFSGYDYPHEWISQISKVANWHAICWSPELSLYCAVAHSAYAQFDNIMISSDGINWTLITSVLVGLIDICWSPKLKLFVVIEDQGSGVVMTSPDGITWTLQSLPVMGGWGWKSICWSPELSLFCAVNQGDPATAVMTSPDGINWTYRTAAAWHFWISICWSPGLSLFVAVADQGADVNKVMTSPDGITWTHRVAASNNRWKDVCWSPELSLFCAVAHTGTDRVMTSSDGINWVSQMTPDTPYWGAICWSPRLMLFVAAAYAGAADRVMTSPDGVNWTSREPAVNNDWRAICWNPNLAAFCMVSNSGTDRVQTSSGAISKDYPSLNWFFEQRHFFATTNSDSNGIWGSQSADYANMRVGTGLADEGLKFIIKAAHKFLWAASGQGIILGGSNAEFKLSANAINEALTPGNTRPVNLTKYGSAFIEPVQIGDSIIFVRNGNRKIGIFSAKALSSGYSESYEVKDATIMSDHIATSGILGMVRTTVPDSIIWAYRNDGVLIGLTYEPEHKVSGWHRHPIGGTDAKVKSLAIAQTVEGESEDELWAVIERTINGSTVQYIEYMVSGLSDEDDIEDAFFLDSGITKTGSGLTTVNGLEHLEGEEVQLLADGAKQTAKTVSGGEITLDHAADKIHVGLQYISTLETLPIELENPSGTSQNLIKKITAVALRLNRTVGFKIGDVHGLLDQYYFGPPVMGEPIPLFTGDTEPMSFSGSYDRQSRVTIIQEDPLPFNLLAIMYGAKLK